MKEVIHSIIVISFFLFLRIFFGLLGYIGGSDTLNQLGNAFLMLAVLTLGFLLISLKKLADKFAELQSELE